MPFTLKKVCSHSYYQFNPEKKEFIIQTGFICMDTVGIKHTRIYIKSKFLDIRGHSKKGNKSDWKAMTGS